MDENRLNEFREKTVKSLLINFFIWLVLFFYQGAIAAATFVIIYGILTFVVLCVNMIVSCKGLQLMKNVKSFGSKEEAEFVFAYFEKVKKFSVLLIILNVVFGGILGCIGSICDFMLAKRVLNEKDEIMNMLPDVAEPKQETEAAESKSETEEKEVSESTNASEEQETAESTDEAEESSDDNAANDEGQDESDKDGE